MIEKNNYVKDINAYHEYNLRDEPEGLYYLSTDKDIGLGITDPIDKLVGSVESVKQLIQLIIYDINELAYTYPQEENTLVGKLTCSNRWDLEEYSDDLQDLGIQVKSTELKQVVEETNKLTLKQLEDILF